MLVYVLLFGAAGGCAFWVYLTYILLHKRAAKRKLIPAATFKAESKKYESGPAVEKILKGGKQNV